MGQTGSPPMSRLHGQMSRPSLIQSSPRLHSKMLYDVVVDSNHSCARNETLIEFLLTLFCLSFRNIIDVSAADSVVMEQHEYMDKARQYRHVDVCLLQTCFYLLHKKNGNHRTQRHIIRQKHLYFSCLK